MDKYPLISAGYTTRKYVSGNRVIFYEDSRIVYAMAALDEIVE